jgi:hypothetical protein
MAAISVFVQDTHASSVETIKMVKLVDYFDEESKLPMVD